MRVFFSYFETQREGNLISLFKQDSIFQLDDEIIIELLIEFTSLQKSDCLLQAT